MRDARIILERVEAVYYISNELKPDLPSLADKDQENLEKTLFHTAEFCKIDIFSYIIHKRGYAMLIRVPVPEQVPLEDLVKMVSRYYGKAREKELLALSDNPSSEKFIKMSHNHRNKLYNVQEFVKLYSKRFSFSYNQKNGRKGSVWRQRFRSYPVEDNTEFIMKAIAFAHTRPLVMKIAENPSDCRYSSWSKSVHGDLKWRLSYRTIAKQSTWKKAKAAYKKEHEIMRSRMNKPSFGWINQKLVDKYRSKNRLTQALLNSRNREWKKKFRQLKKYGEKKGHFRFKRGSRKYAELMRWIRIQRNYFRRGTLRKEYLEAFKSINFSLDKSSHLMEDLSERENISILWLNNFERVKNYALKHKKLQPPYEDKAVSRWISVQRYQSKRNRLSKTQIELLNSIDFPWQYKK